MHRGGVGRRRQSRQQSLARLRPQGGRGVVVEVNRRRIFGWRHDNCISGLNFAMPIMVKLANAQTNTSSHPIRSEEHTSELQSLMRISYAVFCLKKKNIQTKTPPSKNH